MRIMKVKNLKGGECVARPIMYSLDSILIYEGTFLKKEYIERLAELGIEEVFIEDEEDLSEEDKINRMIEYKLKEDYKSIVKNIFEKHTYGDRNTLGKLYDVAERILDDVLKQKEVLEKIIDIKERSNDIYEHSVYVCAFSVLTAIKCKVNNEVLHDIATGSLLHDLGLRYINCKYTNIDIKEMLPIDAIEYKKHTIYGHAAVESEGWMSEGAKSILLLHHERINGSGFPLRQRKLSLAVKIVGICDAFDCMICGIGCKKTKVHEAIEYIKNNQNILFDKEISNQFIEHIAVYPIGSKVKISGGKKAVVVRQNKAFKERPVLKVLEDENGNPLSEYEEIDMLKVLNVFIEEVYD